MLVFTERISNCLSFMEEGEKNEAIHWWRWFSSKEDVIKLGESYGLDVVIVTSVDHYTTKEYANHVQIVYVDRGADSADYKIVGMVKKNDFWSRKIMV